MPRTLKERRGVKPLTNSVRKDQNGFIETDDKPRRVHRVNPKRELEPHNDKNLIREVVEATSEAAARALLKSLFGRLNTQ